MHSSDALMLKLTALTLFSCLSRNENPVYCNPRGNLPKWEPGKHYWQKVGRGETVITSIMFVRHGETLWNQQRRYQGQADSPLSELGLAQAELVGKFLSSRRIDAVYTSDLGRAVQTADCIAKHHGLSAIAIPACGRCPSVFGKA